MTAARVLALALAAAALLGAGDDDAPAGEDRTPPRLAWRDGDVSFLRPSPEGWGRAPSAEGWAPAPVNLPLAPGDRLDTGDAGALELQLGARDFLRAGAQTELALERHEPGLQELRVRMGLVSLDVRGRPAGDALTLVTPAAAVTFGENGSYRVEVRGDATTLTVSDGGPATLLRTAGAPLQVGAGEQVRVTGAGGARDERAAAPEPDAWDRWSLGRTVEQLGAISTRFAGDVYGAHDLDQHGSWSETAPYGSLWIPRVHVAWAPYTAGRWLRDPYYGWTWLDDAPWGWAPFHHGRWIFLRGRWAWAPGPLGPRLVYAPALVAFYGNHRTTVLWVPLGWGEPLRPWWGSPRWLGRPSWLGWGGPRIAAQTHVNAKLRGGSVAVPGAAFGRSPVGRVRIEPPRPGALRAVFPERTAAPPALPRVPAPRYQPPGAPRAPALGTQPFRVGPRATGAPFRSGR